MQPFASSLKTLIIDNNYFFQLDDFPVMPNLQTLSANKNNFNNLEMNIRFIEQCKIKFPSLIHLSLIKNPLCPMFVGEDEYQKYRMQIIKLMPKLVNLDGSMIDPREVNEDYLKIKEQEKLQQIGQQQEEAKGTIEFNAKYTKPQSKTVKSRSEGNRFVKNNQL